MKRGSSPAPKFPNLRSRLLLGRVFKRQFVVSPPPPRWLNKLLIQYERRLRIDLTEIRVERPVFLFGLPRSGTTMLANLMACHPDLGYLTNAMSPFPEAFCAAHALSRRLGLDLKGERFLGDSIDIELGSANDGIAQWARWLDIDLDELDYHRVQRSREDLDPEAVGRIDRDIRKILWCFGGRRRFFSKSNGILIYLGLLGDLFPDAKFVHVVRDPRYCANSLVKLYRRTRAQEDRLRARGWHKGSRVFPFPRLPSLKTVLERWGPEDLRSMSHLWNDGIGLVREAQDIYEVRYEDIVARPGEEMEKIFAHCELAPATSANTRYREQLVQVGQIRHTNDYGGFEQIAEICGEGMRHYGYE